jgi:hypothetical protein
VTGNPAVLDEHRGTAAREAAAARRRLAEVARGRTGAAARAGAHGMDHGRSTEAMSLYRLTPINLNDPNWRASTHRGVAVVRAGSEGQARALAAGAFATTLAPSSPGGRIAAPPWPHAHAVRAEVVRDPRYGSEGAAGILEPWGHT